MSLEKRKITLLSRLQQFLGPITAAILLDLADLTTFGPIGIVTGFIVGYAVVSWIGSINRFSFRTKAVLSLLAGLYCTIPMTELFPLATLIAVGGRFFKNHDSSSTTSANADSSRRKRVDSKIIGEDTGAD